VKEAILRIDCVYDIKNEGTDTLYPVIRNLYLDKVQCNNSAYALFIEGIEGKDCVYGIHLNNCDFKGVVNENSILYASDITLDDVLINGKKSGN